MFEELDTIAAAMDAATTIEEYEAADRRFWNVDKDARTAWLAERVRSL